MALAADQTDSLKVHWDRVFYDKGSDEYDNWNSKLTSDHYRELEAFVTKTIPGRGSAKAASDSVYEGSFNRVIRFTFTTGGNDVALKFPKPGHTVAALAVEKIANEAAWMEYLREKTNIPVPAVHSSGTEVDDLLPGLALPYILMDWVPGENLREFLQTEDSKELRPIILQQIASYYLEFYNLPIDGIGSITRDKATGSWAVGRPLTMDMHQLALGIPDYPIDDWPKTKFSDAAAYYQFVSKQRHQQLWILRDINQPQEVKDENRNLVVRDKPEDLARLRYEARYRINQLLESNQFRLPGDDSLNDFRTFNADFDPRNMNVDTVTGKLGVFDLEFTNGMPITFACDPPLTLHDVRPHQCLDHGFFPWFLHVYQPVLDEFLQVLKTEEQKRGEVPSGGREPLSALMEDSWNSGRVWFNFALIHSNYVDGIYWAAVHRRNLQRKQDMPADVEDDMEKYVAHTKEQLAAYKKSWIEHQRGRQ